VFVALAVENLDRCLGSRLVSEFLSRRGQGALLCNSLGAYQLAGILPRSRKIRTYGGGVGRLLLSRQLGTLQSWDGSGLGSPNLV
jgi:hypothetical protein